MVKEPLVGPGIEFGECILGLLDAAKYPLTAALWIFEKEEERWTLLLVTPLYERAGMGEAYGRLDAALRPAGYYAGLLPIRLEGNRSPFMKDLRRSLGKASRVEGLRFGSERLGNQWIADAYLYRLK